VKYWSGVLIFALLPLSIPGQEPPEIRGSQRLVTADFSLELVGVCRVSETEVRCWGPRGEPAPTLEEELRAGFIVNDHTTLPIRYRQKTRIALFREIRPEETMRSAHISLSARGHFSWPTNRSGTSRPTAVILHAPLGDTVAEVSGTIMRSAPSSEQLPLREGASMTYHGTTFTVRRISEGAERMNPIGRSRSWRIDFTADGTRVPQLSWGAIDGDGVPIRAVDSDGVPSAADPNMAFVPGAGRDEPRVSAPAIHGSYVQPANYTLQMNVDPSKVQALFATTMSRQPFVITGIPLEPRR
jgi:hypothetical protein